MWLLLQIIVSTLLEASILQPDILFWLQENVKIKYTIIYIPLTVTFEYVF